MLQSSGQVRHLWRGVVYYSHLEHLQTIFSNFYVYVYVCDGKSSALTKEKYLRASDNNNKITSIYLFNYSLGHDILLLYGTRMNQKVSEIEKKKKFYP